MKEISPIKLDLPNFNISITTKYVYFLEKMYKIQNSYIIPLFLVKRLMPDASQGTLNVSSILR